MLNDRVILAALYEVGQDNFSLYIDIPKAFGYGFIVFTLS